MQSLPASAIRQATLIFSGHSLGGALSPTLALAFFNPNGGKLSLSNWAKVYVSVDVTSLSPGAKNQAALVPVVNAMLSGPEGA